MATFAGVYGPESITDPAGNALIGETVTVYEAGTNNLATLYDGFDKDNEVANPTTTDSRGNLTFYADPARLEYSVNGVRYLAVLYADPNEPGGVLGGIDHYSDLVDVDTTGVVDGDVPIYNNTSGKWEPGPQSGGGALDADLTTIAALDSTTAGALVTDGSGWIRKTYAQLKTALGLTKSDVGLSNVDNTSDASKPVSTAQQTALDAKTDKATFDANTILKADADNTPVALAVGASTIIGRLASGGIAALTTSEVKTLLGLDDEGIQDLVGAMVSGNTETNITVTYDDSTGKLNFVASGGGGGGGAVVLDDLTDVDLTGIASGVFLKYNGTSWVVETLDKGDVGLGNVDNTSDANKPISTATQTALNNKQDGDADLTSIAGLTPTNDDVIQRKAGSWVNRTIAQLKSDFGLTKSDVGLSNVDNTSDASKPVSTATQTALNAKQDGDADLTAIAGLTPTNDDIIQRKAGSWINRTMAQLKTDLGLTKSDVGLSNVTNVAQVDKTLYDANTILYATSDDTPVALTVAASTVVGRKASGGIVALTVAELQTLLTLDTVGVGYVHHGSTAGTARPTGFANIIWVGTVAPTNAQTYDQWINA